jgi:flagellar protein FlbD
MIVLHRLAHEAEPFHLNPDLIVTVEACPDTVLMLATGARILVCEDPATVAREVLQWKADVRRAALHVVNTEDLLTPADRSRS